jgi:hypothetical protein
MAQADSNNEALKRSSKEALVDTLHEQHELPHQVLPRYWKTF